MPKVHINWLFASLFFFASGSVYAQDQAQEAPTVPAVAETAPTAVAPTDTAKQDDVAQPAVAMQKSDDPGDVIANYFSAMANLVQANLDTPAALIDKFDAFVKENEKSMRNASKKFDDKLRSLKATDAEVYRETVQRKITPELNRLIGLLIDFGSRYPTDAQKLDSILKVDAKYTYQQ